jgi:hypothetical protein
MSKRRSNIYLGIAIFAFARISGFVADATGSSGEDTTTPELSAEIVAGITDPAQQPHGTFIDPSTLPKEVQATLAKIKLHTDRATVEQMCGTDGGLYGDCDRRYIVPGYTKDHEMLKISIVYKLATMPVDVYMNYRSFIEWVQQHRDDKSIESAKDEVKFVSAPYLEYMIMD